MELMEQRVTGLDERLEAEKRCRAVTLLRPEIPPPPGFNGMEFVFGQLSGDETDAEMREALDAVE